MAPGGLASIKAPRKTLARVPGLASMVSGLKPISGRPRSM
jgi:hypothetical protein